TILPAASRGPRREPSGSGLEALAERIGLHEVREGADPVDLDDRQERAVAGLELGATADVDQLELEAELRANRLDHLERPCAEAAVAGVVDRHEGSWLHDAAAAEQPPLE